jgi:hypothetical protein
VATSAHYADGTLKKGTATRELLDGIRDNTSIDKLTEVLWYDKISSAKASEKIFSDNSGKYGFKPTTMENVSVSDYKDNIGELGNKIDNTKKTFTKENAEELAESDKVGWNDYNDTLTIKSALSDAGKPYSKLPLTQGDFYKILNEGGEVESTIGGKKFTSERLINSLNTGTKIGNAFEGSYEHYMKEYLGSEEYEQYYGENA